MEITKREMRIFKRVTFFYIRRICPLIVFACLILVAGAFGGYHAGNMSGVRLIVILVSCLLALCFAIANQE